MSLPEALIGRVLFVAITAAFAYVTLWLFAVVRFFCAGGASDDDDEPAVTTNERRRRHPLR